MYPIGVPTLQAESLIVSSRGQSEALEAPPPESREKQAPCRGASRSILWRHETAHTIPANRLSVRRTARSLIGWGTALFVLCVLEAMATSGSRGGTQLNRLTGKVFGRGSNCWLTSRYLVVELPQGFVLAQDDSGASWGKSRVLNVHYVTGDSNKGLWGTTLHLKHQRLDVYFDPRGLFPFPASDEDYFREIDRIRPRIAQFLCDIEPRLRAEMSPALHRSARITTESPNYYGYAHNSLTVASLALIAAGIATLISYRRRHFFPNIPAQIKGPQA